MNSSGRDCWSWYHSGLTKNAEGGVLPENLKKAEMTFHTKRQDKTNCKLLPCDVQINFIQFLSWNKTNGVPKLIDAFLAQRF